MAKCVQLLKACQDVEAKLDYGFDWTREFSRRWEADHSYGIGVVIRPETTPTGYEYVSSGGQSGAIEPEFPSSGTVEDGSIVWTAQAISTASLRETIASDTWAASIPAGLTVEAQVPTNTAGLQMTSVILSGGVIDETYTVDNEVVTASGKEYIARIEIKVA